MAIGSYFGAGTLANHSSGGQASLAVALTAAIGIDDLLVALVAVDNASTVQATDEGAVASVVDDAGNSWQKVAEITCTEGLGIADGVVCAVWFCNPVTPLAIGNNVTINFAAPLRNDAAASIAAWPLAVGGTAAVSDAPVRSAVIGAPDALDLITSGISVLRLRAIASELKNSIVLTATPGFDGVVDQAVGSSTSAVGIRAEYFVTTLTDAPSQPSLFTADHASIYVAFEEVPPVDGDGALAADPATISGVGVSSSHGSGALVVSAAVVRKGLDLERAATVATGGGKAHVPWRFFIGDTWLIEFTLADRFGVVYDITHAALEWKLDDAAKTKNFFTLTNGAG